MGLSRRFLNLIVNDFTPGGRSLCCIDLTRQQLFHPTTSPPANGDGSQSTVAQDSTFQTPAVVAGDHKDNPGAAAHLTMETIRLPDPTFSFEAAVVPHKWKLDVFPLADRKLICADEPGRAFLFDAVTRRVLTMPRLFQPRSLTTRSISLFVPGADDPDDHGGVGGGSSVFIMEGFPQPEVGTRPSVQFEAFVYRKTSLTAPWKTWDRQLLPPPPFVRDPPDLSMYWHNPSKITAYAVVGGGSHVCVSVEGTGHGTYCLDTASYTWSQVGRWTLPFRGKAEYVPELKLWFGFAGTEDEQFLAAADLSSMYSRPQLVGSWKELSLNPPEDWVEAKAQLVSLGSGRFCIARFYDIWAKCGFTSDYVQSSVVLTGVEVMPKVHDANGNGNCSRSNGRVKLRMVNHKSICHTSVDNDIEAVF